jgi:hypothetical protein
MPMNPASPRSTHDGVPTPLAAGIVLALALCLSGCSLPEPDQRAATAETLLDWPELPQATPERIVLQIDRNASQVRIRVDPAGPLARLGHSHVIGGSVLDGRVLLGETLEDSAVDLALDVAALEVDRPDWRTEAGLEPDLDPDAVAGTRSNLLGPRVLDSDRFPRIEVRSTSLQHSAEGWRMNARIRLQDRIHAVELPLQLSLEGQALVATGEFERSHAELGLEPFSTAGGALRVGDPIGFRFRIVAVGRSDDVAIIRKLMNSTTGLP